MDANDMDDELGQMDRVKALLTRHKTLWIGLPEGYIGQSLEPLHPFDAIKAAKGLTIVRRLAEADEYLKTTRPEAIFIEPRMCGTIGEPKAQKTLDAWIKRVAKSGTKVIVVNLVPHEHGGGDAGGTLLQRMGRALTESHDEEPILGQGHYKSLGATRFVDLSQVSEAFKLDYLRLAIENTLAPRTRPAAAAGGVSP